MYRLLQHLILITAVMVNVATAAPARPPRRAANIPPVEQLDPLVMQWAVRATVARGLTYLTNQIACDDAGWAVAPIRTSRLVGYTNRVIRYVEKTTPLYEYENYTVYARVPGDDSQSARTLKPVTRRRIKRVIDPEGGPKRLYRDPNGPIAIETRDGVYERTGPDRWPHGVMALNGMALYTLVKGGVGAEDHNAALLADNLVRLVTDYGAPDATCDLAWITIALANWPDDAAAEATRICAVKLLDGQIMEGKARGLWGPVSINVSLLAAAYQYEQVLHARQERAAVAARERPDRLSRDANASHASAELHRFQRQMQRIALLALAFDEIDDYAVKIGEDESDEVYLTGLPHYIFNQTTADLESTALALRALREASDAKRLPAETWRPKIEGIAGVPRPERADAVMARAANALTRLQLRNGSWSASNMHQPVSAFDRMARMLPGLPVDSNSFPPLPSPETPLAALQGYAALVDIGAVVGFERALGRFRDNFAGGLAAARYQVGRLPDRTVQDVVGGRVSPGAIYEASFHSLPAYDAPATRRRELNTEWSRLAFELLSTQQTNGVWERAGSIYAMPTSMRVRTEVLPKRDKDDASRIMERNKAHIRYNWPHPWHPSGFVISRQPLATCQALIFLLSGCHPPFLSVNLPDQPLPGVVVDRTLDELAAATGVDWRHATVDLSRDDPLLGIDPPAIFIAGKESDLHAEGLRQRLIDYVKAGGILIVLNDAADPAGAAFAATLATVAATACESDQQLCDVANEQGVLGDLAGRLGRSLQGVLRPDGALAVLILPLAPTPGPGAFSQAEAARIVSTALRRNLDDTLLSPAFAYRLDTLGEPGTLHAKALEMLRAPIRQAVAPAPPPATAAKPATAAVASKPAAVAPAKATPQKPQLPIDMMAPPAAAAPEADKPPAADEVW